MRAVVLATALGPGAASAQDFVVYDDFSASSMDLSRWVESERRREVAGKQLAILQRDHGSTSSDSGVSGQSFSTELSFPGRVTQISARLRMLEAAATPCAANPSFSAARARLIGTFFNTGTPASGSFTGDVMMQAYLRKSSDPAESAETLKVVGSVLVCASSDCNTSRPIGSVDLGQATIGQPVLLQVEWDRAGKRFVFRRDDTVTGEVAYTVSDGSAPGRPYMALATRTETAACSAGHTTSFVDARFDNVLLNRTAVW
ncbi:MAG: hypothetical protein HYZ20_11445 [Burkholderiales bacterium]|nr:hypothetical protein [Burkholderiales bacterium]